MESRLGAEGLREHYPLELISPKSHDGMNSTFGHRPEVDSEQAVLHLHASDASARGISSGDRARVFNARGSCVLEARLDGAVPPGVAMTPAVRWSKRSADRRNVNVLTSDRLTDMGGGPVFYSCMVEVERCED
jgi:anaerobic selenocysteine-containing dehydrogenase